MKIAGYQETHSIYSGNRTRVYGAIRSHDRQPVIVKILRNPQPSFNELVGFRNQYIISSHLEHPAIAKSIALERCDNGYAIIMPDEGNICLSEYWSQASRTLAEFLAIAVQLTDALHYLIQQRVIHKDIKPANILIHPETHQVKLIDFSISSLLPKEQKQLTNPNVLEGSLAYISPEQTGRMNRGVDYRTDFYSLGVTFFELLTGKLPFDARDPMEWIHGHIAKTAKFPARGEGETVPAMLQAIVLKLMAKNAEDRYQSALGLRHDLEQCQQQWATTGKIDEFALLERDMCDRFLIPEKLYGRELEVQTLLDAFDRVSQGTTEMILVAGFSGIGKTAVINEVHKPIVKQRGYFIEGKFDQFNRNIPFSAFVQAFQDLMAQFLGESDARLTDWQGKILAAVGDNGQILINAIPALEKIIGKQPPVPEISGNAAQNRFNLLFGKFVRVFATREHPLVIFLDDLQWADSASLNLLKLLMNESESGYLLVLGAYRNNEVFPAHPLMLTLTELAKTRVSAISTVTLSPLTLDCLDRLVAETLSCSEALARPLTELAYQKTQGNPFFTTQFLQELQVDGLITFNPRAGYWECDLVRVRDAAMTDDVVKFMARRLQKLPEATQQVLQRAACIGNQFDLETLAVACQASPEQVAVEIWDALQEGLILPLGETYQFFREEATETLTRDEQIGYRFLHDRIQQAAYSLIPEDRKQQTHRQIGLALQQKMRENPELDYLFAVLNHLNQSCELIAELKERRTLVELNLLGCQRARRATAYDAADLYINTALTLWQDYLDDDPQLTITLQETAAEIAYLTAAFDRAEQSIAEILHRCDRPLDSIQAYALLVQIYIAKDQQLQAIETGLAALRELGIPFIDRQNWQEHLPPLPALPDLDGHRQMTDPVYLAALQILIAIVPPTHHIKPELFPAVVLTMLELCDREGFCELTAYAYGIYGLLLEALVGDPETAHRAGRLSLALLDRFGSRTLRTKVNMLFAVFVCAAKESGRATLPLLEQGIEVGLDVGDIEYVSYCIMGYISHLFLLGLPLEQIYDFQKHYFPVIEQFKQEHCLEYFQIWMQATDGLMGAEAEPTQRESKLAYFEATHNHQCLFAFYLSQSITCYFLERYALAEEYAIKALESQEAAFGILLTAAHNFYYSLILLARIESVETEMQRVAILEQIDANQAKLKHLAAEAPSNYLHKFQLVAAECCRVRSRRGEALEWYDLAIAGAKDNEYLQEEALANELAAKFYLDWGKVKLAAGYLQEAYYGYNRWGAQIKTDCLERHYPDLLSPILDPPKGETLLQSTTPTMTSTATDISSSFDLATVLKANQAISGEIVLDRLLSALMNILVENAGAQRGILLLSSQNNLTIAATKELESAESIADNFTPIEEFDNICTTIVRYVARTKEAVFLDDATREGNFTDDAYIQEHQCQSIACVPFINQGKLQGIIYLENNLTAGAFTQERVALLQTLATQAAISLENARFYDACKRFVPERFLSLLDKKSIVGVKLGDRVEREMTVLFSDIRDFTTMSEQMTPAENFTFINEYLGHMEPLIQHHGGFIDKYIGDAIMALFPTSADDAVSGSIAMLEELKRYNQFRQENNQPPIKIGIGLHTGKLMLGMVGGMGRMDGTAIGDAVNLSSRVEGLTKTYGAALLITYQTWQNLNNSNDYEFRFIDKVKAKGKTEAVGLLEVFSADPPELKSAKIATRTKFEKAVLLYHSGSFKQAANLFQECLDYHGGDRAAQIYLDRCQGHGT